MLSPDDAAVLPGATVFDPADEEIGTVAEVYPGVGDDHPAWAAVEREGYRVLVPLDGARRDGDALRVRYDRTVVEEAPEPAGGAPDDDLRHELLAHYGLPDAP